MHVFFASTTYCFLRAMRINTQVGGAIVRGIEYVRSHQPMPQESPIKQTKHNKSTFGL